MKDVHPLKFHEVKLSPGSHILVRWSCPFCKVEFVKTFKEAFKSKACKPCNNRVNAAVRMRWVRDRGNPMEGKRPFKGILPRCARCRSIVSSRTSKHCQPCYGKIRTQRGASVTVKKLKGSLRRRLNNAVKHGWKKGSAVADLGCSVEQFKTYVESKFQTGMSWGNWGLIWHIDHVRPLSHFDLTDLAQFKKACHFTNHQPMFRVNNFKKGDRLPVVYLVTGTFGAGKTWVCKQLTEYAHYFAYDQNRRGNHLETLCNPPDFDKPTLYDRNINVNKFVKDAKGLLDLRSVFIVEPESVIRDRLAKRGGVFTQAVAKKMRRMEFLAERHAVFAGSAEEGLAFLKLELGVK